MRLLVHLLLRVFAVILLCLVATTGWILVDTHRGIEDATKATVERAAGRLQTLYWQELLWRDGLTRYTKAMLPRPDWQTLWTARVIAPGICVGFTSPGAEPGRLCSEAEGVYPPAPVWFGQFYDKLFGAFPTASRPLDIHQRNVGNVTATADPDTALRLAWLQVGLMARMAAAMAAAIGLLVASLLAHALLPVRAIIDGMRHLEAGDLAHRLGRRAGRFEFGRIAAAFDHLAERLGETQAARAALTRRLFQVQEEERRALARDLHDEFGQCLAATGALAGSIAAGATDRPDLAADARAIGVATRRMMTTLKDALVRLRSQDIDDLGLEACLEELAAKWSGRGTAVALETRGDLAGVPRAIAISLYRIAQECLTNAARHGAARNISLRIEAAGGEAVSLSVEDDGGGDPARLGGGTGHGILGIRERIAALGGSLAIGRAARGISVAASIPFRLPGVPEPA